MDDWGDLWSGDFSKLDVASESVAIYDPAAPGGEVHGRDALESYIRKLHTAFPDFTMDMHENDMLTSDDVVMIEWTGTGTHEGEFAGIPPTGREFRVIGMSKILISDGKVQEDRIYFDPRELLDQLGLTFPAIVYQAPKLVWRKIKSSL